MTPFLTVGLSSRATILATIGSIGNTHGVNAKPNPAKNNNTNANHGCEAKPKGSLLMALSTTTVLFVAVVALSFAGILLVTLSPTTSSSAPEMVLLVPSSASNASSSNKA